MAQGQNALSCDPLKQIPQMWQRRNVTILSKYVTFKPRVRPFLIWNKLMCIVFFLNSWHYCLCSTPRSHTVFPHFPQFVPLWLAQFAVNVLLIGIEDWNSLIFSYQCDVCFLPSQTRWTPGQSILVRQSWPFTLTIPECFALRIPRRILAKVLRFLQIQSGIHMQWTSKSTCKYHRGNKEGF